MASSIETLPVEIIEKIVCLLPLDEIRALRRTCRSLASKSSQGILKSYFKTKDLHLVAEALKTCVELTEARSLACTLEDLTLVSIVNNTVGLEAVLRKKTTTVIEKNGPIFMSTQRSCKSEELEKAKMDLQTLKQRQAEAQQLRDSGRDIELLSDAFRNIARNGKLGKLRKLRLEVMVYRQDAETKLQPINGGGWKLVWEAAAYAFHTTMAALGKSGLQIDDLYIFSDQWRCSLACNEVSKIDFDNCELDTFFSRLKTLSMSISSRLIDETDKDESRLGDPDDVVDWKSEWITKPEDELSALASDAANFQGVASMLQRTLNLEQLDLHWYHLSYSHIKREQLQFHRLFDGISENSSMPKLTVCRFRGLETTEDALLAFFQKCPSLKELIMEEIHCKSGTFQPVFDFYANKSSKINRIHFDDLWEQRLLSFDEPGTPKFPIAGPAWGPNTITREGADVQKPIRYHFNLGYPLGSPQAYRWREQRRLDYGPP